MKMLNLLLIFCAQILYPFQMICCFQVFVLVHSHKILTIQQGKFFMQWNGVEDRECLLAERLLQSVRVVSSISQFCKAFKEATQIN